MRSGSRAFLVIVLVAGALLTGVPVAAAQGGNLSLEARGAATSPAAADSQVTPAKKKCARLTGKKLRRCKALAKCKRLKGKKRKKCLAKARRIGVKREQPPRTVQPPGAIQPPRTVPPPGAIQPPPTLLPPPTLQPPPGTLPPPAANQAPQWPNPFRSDITTNFHYDSFGRLAGATTTINVLTPAVDPDGDPLTYTWIASNGSISASGLTATWTRVIEFGRPKSGTVTVTASDGKGGSTPFDIRFL